MAASAKPTLRGELIAEFLGTMVLLALGNGVNAMVALFGTGLPGEIVKGGYTSITIGWSMGVLMGICVAARVSGAHLNPAVTLALAVYRQFPWSKVLPYSLAQIAGGFAGAALVLINYYPAFKKLDPGFTETAGVFATFPAFPDAAFHGLFDQIIGTALLIGLLLAIIDPRNQPLPAAINPVMVALVVLTIGTSWGGMHGYAINPARDLGPRLLTLAAGFRNTGFESGIWLVPVVGPLLGALLGGVVYDFLIRPSLPERAPGT